MAVLGDRLPVGAVSALVVSSHAARAGGRDAAQDGEGRALILVRIEPRADREDEAADGTAELVDAVADLLELASREP